LLPAINLFGYVQVKSLYGSGHFYTVLRESFPDQSGTHVDAAGSKVIVSRVNERDDMYDSLRLLFKAGR